MIHVCGICRAHSVQSTLIFMYIGLSGENVWKVLQGNSCFDGSRPRETRTGMYCSEEILVTHWMAIRVCWLWGTNWCTWTRCSPTHPSCRNSWIWLGHLFAVPCPRLTSCHPPRLSREPGSQSRATNFTSSVATLQTQVGSCILAATQTILITYLIVLAIRSLQKKQERCDSCHREWPLPGLSPYSTMPGGEFHTRSALHAMEKSEFWMNKSS